MQTAPGAPTYASGKRSVAPASTEATDGSRGEALEFLRHLATETSSGIVDLPCFPDVVIRIRNALADPSTTAEQTVAIVGAEPLLAARLLQTANSAAFNQSGKPVSDLRTAITRLGQQLVQSAAMAFAVRHMKNEQSLRSIATALSTLWRQSIGVASICHVMARRTKVGPEEAFLTGLLHGIGRLYIMVRALELSREPGHQEFCIDLVSGWHPAIGKAVLENWNFAAEMSEAVGNQEDCAGEHERKLRHEADLTDILVASIALREAFEKPAPHTVDMHGIAAFAVLGLSAEACVGILAHAKGQLGSLQDVLGC